MGSSKSSPSYLVPCDDRRGYRFHSHSSLCSLLCISSPYCQCLAFAPRARMAPRCSRRVNEAKKKEVPDLLANLLQTRIPSTRAGGLLEELSTRVVCGKNPGCWHQGQATEIYKGWCVKLWGEYLREHGLDPELWKEAPSRLTRETWEADLEVAQAQEGYDPDEEEDYDSYDNESYSESEESVATPDTTISDFDQSPPDGDTLTPSQGLHTSGQSSRRPESPADSRRPSKGATNIYRDPEVSSVDSAPVGDGRALRRLDQNIPVSRRPSKRTPPSWSHEAPDAVPPPPAVSRRREPCPADPRKTTHQLESNMGHSSSDGKSLAISDDEASVTPEETEGEETESEDEEIASGGYQYGKDDGGEEQTQAGTDGGLPHHDRASPEDDSAQDEAEEEEPPVAVDITGGVGYDDDDGDGCSDCTDSEAEAEADGGDVEDAAAAAAAAHAATDDSVALLVRATAPGFRLYPQALTPLSQLKDLLHIMTQTVTALRRRAGFIYAFARPSLPGFLKIGYVQDARVDRRLSKWQAACGHPVTEVFRTRIACAAVERIESLVHATLREHRRVEDPPCERCESRKRERRQKPGERRAAAAGVRHDEWFEVEEQAAKEVVDAWTLFAEQRPYDRFGRLVDFWSEKVDGEMRRVKDGDTAKSWLKTMPEMVEESRRWKRKNIIGPLLDSLGAKTVPKKVRTW
ncbi:hypothetical protein QBC46DRAFT_312338 [Diplogelasinospora grovesii]|uniref:Bacteriophage T5 Orf172 DNA-binding domain-containing protein n=1 Tax=Diplogelasinospora grovesii TaxID=303347 RepID=A0AAN6NAC2_9PEZI|nr:hypothetical protein QBC46DRAFT_312338 [Diplogelasinospora grovesii]